MLAYSINCLYYNSNLQCDFCKTAFRRVVTANVVTCEPRTIAPTNAVDNCLAYSLFQGANVCSLCAPGFYIAANGGQCVGIASALVANCRVHSAAATCAVCNASFYLSNNQCLPVPAIAYCEVYASANVCAQCSLDYVLNALGTACFSLASLPSCKYFSRAY